MHALLTVSAALSLTAICPFVRAQNQDIYITNQNVLFGVEFNSSRQVYSGTGDFFMADPSGDPAGVLFKTAWAYRIDNDTREFVLTEAGAMFNSTGAIGTAMWPDVDARGKIAATALYQAIPLSANSGVVAVRMLITNISASPVTLNLFHMADPDLCGSAYTSNVITPGNDGRQIITGSCTETAEQFAACADRWEVGSYTGIGGSASAGYVDLYTKLEDTNLTTLRNDTQPFGPYDIRGAFQWEDRVIQPNESETFTLAFTHNASACPYAFTRFGQGLAGGLGVPTLNSVGNASLGQTFSLGVGNAPPGTQGIVVLGFLRGTSSFGDLTLYVGNPSSTFLVPIDPMGNGALPVPVPNFPAFCSLDLFGQCFILGDTTSTSTTNLPVTHTRAGCWVVGAY